MARKDLLTRLADAGEDALGKLGEAPGMDRMVGFANTTRDRLDELTRRVRGVEDLERRVRALEKRLDEMSGTTSGSSTPAKRKSPARKKTPSKGSTAKTGGGSPG